MVCQHLSLKLWLISISSNNSWLAYPEPPSSTFEGARNQHGGLQCISEVETVTVRSGLLRVLGIGEMHCIFVLFMPICDCLLSVKF